MAGVLREAGSLAMRRGDAYSAVAYLRRALEEGPADADRVRMLWELGAAEARVDSEASAERLRQVQDDLDDPLQRALAADVLARSLLWTRPAHEAVTVAQRAVAELGSTHADQRRALEATELYAVFFGGVQVPDWRGARLVSVNGPTGMPDSAGSQDAGRGRGLGLGPRRRYGARVRRARPRSAGRRCSDRPGPRASERRSPAPYWDSPTTREAATRVAGGDEPRRVGSAPSPTSAR